MSQLLTVSAIERTRPNGFRHPASARSRNLKHMIGNTPLLAIRYLYRGRERVIYAKAEHMNMTGSIKDRMAFHILKKAYQEDREPLWPVDSRCCISRLARHHLSRHSCLLSTHSFCLC